MLLDHFPALEYYVVKNAFAGVPVGAMRLHFTDMGPQDAQMVKLTPF
jgi:hypothetical protein|tara:strand:- start:5155 stop:5295 length:141 start_codon:yes stop_codon:yes gene_type:complete